MISMPLRDYMIDPPEYPDTPDCPCCGSNMYSKIYKDDATGDVLGCDYCFNYYDISEEDEENVLVLTAEEWFNELSDEQDLKLWYEESRMRNDL